MFQNIEEVHIDQNENRYTSKIMSRVLHQYMILKVLETKAIYLKNVFSFEFLTDYDLERNLK
jgi:hypothetical protein